MNRIKSNWNKKKLKLMNSREKKELDDCSIYVSLADAYDVT